MYYETQDGILPDERLALSQIENALAKIETIHGVEVLIAYLEKHAKRMEDRANNAKKAAMLMADALYPNKTIFSFEDVYSCLLNGVLPNVTEDEDIAVYRLAPRVIETLGLSYEEANESFDSGENRLKNYIRKAILRFEKEGLLERSSQGVYRKVGAPDSH